MVSSWMVVGERFRRDRRDWVSLPGLRTVAPKVSYLYYVSMRDTSHFESFVLSKLRK